MPQKIWSLHWIKDQQFSKAIEQYLDEETKILNNQKENLNFFDKVKERILEYLAVQKRVGKIKGAILCLGKNI